MFQDTVSDCPESVTFKSLSYSKVQEVCGQCELHVYDVCEVCLRLFPLDDENSFRCSTTGCVGYVEKIYIYGYRMSRGGVLKK